MSNRLTDLSQRINRLRLPQKAIAEQSGLNEDTVSRTLTGKTDPLNSTLDRIDAVVTAEEETIRKALKQGAA